MLGKGKDNNGVPPGAMTSLRWGTDEFIAGLASDSAIPSLCKWLILDLGQRKVRKPDSGGSKEEPRKTCFSFPFAHVSPRTMAVSHCCGLVCIFLTDSRLLEGILHFIFPHLAPYLNRGKHSLCMFLENSTHTYGTLNYGKDKWVWKCNFDSIQDRGIMYH